MFFGREEDEEDEEEEWLSAEVRAKSLKVK
jgi:hypothetical protein